MPRIVSAVVVGSLLAATVPARAEVPLGPEFQVNSHTTGAQFNPAVAAAPDGGFVVTWDRDDGSDTGIFGRRFDASGAPLGATDFRVNAYTPGAQYISKVAFADHRFVVAWTGPSSTSEYPGEDVFARPFDADSGLADPELQANTNPFGRQSFPDVAADPDGNFVVVWTDESPYGLDDWEGAVVGRQFDASGVPRGPEFLVNTVATSFQVMPQAAMDAAGNFVVVWENNAPGESDIAGQRFSADGEKIGGEFRVNTYTTGWQYQAAVASAPDGRFVVVWSSVLNNVDWNVHGQLYDASGAPVGTEFLVNTYTTGSQGGAQVAMDAQGRFVVAWNSFGTDLDVFAQKFDALGGRRGEPFRLHADAAGHQSGVDVAAAADGTFVAVWNSHVGDTDGGIRGRRFLPVVDHIFSDGFESGTLGAWSASSTDAGDLAPSIFAAMRGSSVGVRGVVDDTAGIYVEDATPEGEPRYRARFWLDPNGFDPGEALNQRRTRTFIVFSGPPARRVAAIVLRRVGGVYAVMARARLDDNSQVDTAFFTITDAPHAVEIDLQAASGPDAQDGWLELWVDGVSVQRLTALDNHLATADFVRLGALSVKAGARGTLFWDEFVSRRGTAIGP